MLVAYVECANISSVNFALQVDWMYYVAFGAVVVGLIIYSGYVISHFVSINYSYSLHAESLT